jgi:flagellar motor protein MotB
MTALLLTVLALLGSDAPGTTVMPFFKLGQGARAAALGESYIGIADDATALYWNPAGLGQLTDYRFAFSHQQWFSDTRDELAHVALPAGPGALGLSAAYTAEPGIESWDENNQPGDTFQTWGGAFALGYGATLIPNYRIGAALKFGLQNLLTDWVVAGAADVGFQARPVPGLGIGVTARNLGIGWSTELERLPADLALGAAYSWRSLTGTADISLPFDNQVSVRAGVEYQPVRQLAVRLGYRAGPADLSELGFWGGLTAGLGVNAGGFDLDYAISPYGRLGIAHRLTLSARARRQGRGNLALSVVDEQTRQPTWANVALSGVIRTARPEITSAEFGHLPAGRLVIRTSRDGFATRTDTMTIAGDRVQTAIIALRRLEYGGLSGGIFAAGTRKPLAGSITYQGPVYGSLDVDPNLGTFVVRSIPSGNYVVTAEGPTADYITQTCTLAVVAQEMTNHDFLLVRKNQTIVLEGITFETGKADILPQFENVLNTAGSVLRANPGVTVEIAGHTDPREISTPQYPSNWELSRARAEAVRRYLIEKFGIAADRLAANGYADSQPVASNDTDEGMARNRRVEFRITGSK